MTTLEAESHLKHYSSQSPNAPCDLRNGLVCQLLRELLVARKTLHLWRPDAPIGTVSRVMFDSTTPIFSPKFEAPMTPLTNKKIDQYAREGHYGKDAQIAANARASKRKKVIKDNPAPSKQDFDSFMASLLK